MTEVPEFDGLRTFSDWPLLGRTVRKGEKASFYVLSPDRRSRLALFREDQTEPRSSVIADEGWTEVVSAAEVPKNAKRVAPGEKVIVDYDPATQKVSIWVGASKNGLDLVRKHSKGFVFEPRTRRWTKTIGADIDGLLRKMAAWEIKGEPALRVEYQGPSS